jgi:hypothetical protein
MVPTDLFRFCPCSFPNKSFDCSVSVVDPNPKKSESFGWIRIRNRKKFGFGYGFGFGSRHCCRMKICLKNRRSNTWKRKYLMFFYWKIFFSGIQVPEHIWKQFEAPFRKIGGQNISLRIRIRIRIRKKLLDPNPNPKKMSSDPQHCVQYKYQFFIF